MSQLLENLRQRKRDLLLNPTKAAPPKHKKRKEVGACGFVGRLLANYFTSFEFFLMLARGFLIFWVCFYTSLFSLPLLLFFLHSLLYRNKSRFVGCVSFVYLPYLMLLSLFHHIYQSVVSN